MGLLAVMALVLGIDGAVASAPPASRAEPTGTVTASQLGSSATPAWYDSAWQYRRAVQIGYPGSATTTVSNYQVRVDLGSSFDFSHTQANGDDLRVTSADGTTLIPFWIESWDPTGGSAAIWIKVPEIPVGGTTVYLYYGNASATTPTPTPVPTPPIGPFTKASNNPQPITGAPCTNQILPEDMVESGGTYYVVVTNRCGTNSIALLSASSPSGPWTWGGNILTPGDLGSDPLTQLDSPDLVQVGSDWYLFYSHYAPGGFTTTTPAPIGLAESTTGIDGPYTELNGTVLGTDPAPSWDQVRVAEPYVLQESNGNWVMVFMGDSGNYTEQVGIATSTSGIAGPYTKSTGDPVLAFGPPGSLDAGTIADPWVLDFQGTYYIGYTASSTKAGWSTTYATTTDWTTFTKSNTVILAQGPTYDSISAFRGAVTLFGDTYYFPYAAQDGSGFHFAMATQPLDVAPASIVDNPNKVFDFYDGFSGTSLDSSKWSVSTRQTPGGSATVSGGHLTLSAPATGTTPNVEEVTANTAFGPGGVLFEASARHDTAAGNGLTAGEAGLGSPTFDPSLRIVDYSSATNFQYNVSNGGQGGDVFPTLAQPLDSTDYLLHRVGWAQPGAVTFALGSDTPVSASTNIPTQALPPWFAAVALGQTSTISVDWVRVRNWVGADATATVGSEETNLQPQTISFPPIPDHTYGDADFDPGATASSGLAVSYSASPPDVCSVTASNEVHIVGVGDCTVTASQSGDDQYAAAEPVSQSFGVAKAAQQVSVTSTAPDNAVVGGTYGVTATGGGSGNPVVLAASPSSVCSLPPDAAGTATVSFVGSGTCTISATQAGDADYLPGSATQSFTVYSRVVTGRSSGFTMGPGDLVKVTDATVSGPITVRGGQLWLESSTLDGPFTAKGADSLSVCGSALHGPVTVASTSGAVVFGGANDVTTCPGNTVSGPATFSSNLGGLEYGHNTIVGGDVTLKSNTAPVLVQANTSAHGSLTCQPKGDTIPTGTGNAFKAVDGCPNVS